MSRQEEALSELESSYFNHLLSDLWNLKIDALVSKLVVSSLFPIRGRFCHSNVKSYYFKIPQNWLCCYMALTWWIKTLTDVYMFTNH